MHAARRESVAEFTLKAVTTGVLLGIVFGAANAYLGLRVGMTVSTSIPSAVIAVVLFRLLARHCTILEVNIAQTIGSASTALATGTIFTIPALFMWGVIPPYFQIVVLCFLGGLLGLAAMIPLRRMLIVDEHKELAYPEGTACAKVLKTTTEASRSGRWIFYGIGVGIVVKLSLSALFLFPSSVAFAIPVLPKAQIALELAPALLAVGFILGYRQSAVLVSGAIVSALVMTPLLSWVGSALTVPLFPEPKELIANMNAGAIWSRYVRYIGAGAVATAGICTVLLNLPSMYGAFAAVLKGLRKGAAQQLQSAVKPTDRDLPAACIVGAILFVIGVAAFVPGVFSGDMPLVARIISALGVGIFGVLFVAVAARIVGIVGVSSQPTSGIALVTLLGVATVFAAQGWNDLAARTAVLTVGTIVAIAASKAGDISQDLKTGYLVGATPAKQQLGQFIGLSFACFAVAATVCLLGTVYEFGSPELPAPQATLMKTIIEGVLQGDLPWSLVLTGAGLAITAMLCGVSGLAFAIGVYLPLASMLPVFVGGCMRRLSDKCRKGTVDPEHDPGVLAASGLVAGEGLTGIVIAGMVAFDVLPKGKGTLLAGNLGTAAVLLVVGLLCLFLVGAGTSKKTASGR